jgi:hypothetical protein
MPLKCSKPQISKMGLVAKIDLTSQFLQFFHPESTKIDEQLYNDLIWINHNSCLGNPKYSKNLNSHDHVWTC